MASPPADRLATDGRLDGGATLSFDEIRAGARLSGLDGPGDAEVIDVTPFGPDALNAVYRIDGPVSERLVYRGDEAGLSLAVAGRAFAFDADGEQLRLASEA